MSASETVGPAETLGLPSMPPGLIAVLIAAGGDWDATAKLAVALPNLRKPLEAGGLTASGCPYVEPQPDPSPLPASLPWKAPSRAAIRGRGIRTRPLQPHLQRLAEPAGEQGPGSLPWTSASQRRAGRVLAHQKRPVRRIGNGEADHRGLSGR
jgi:hypothetical protein